MVTDRQQGTLTLARKRAASQRVVSGWRDLSQQVLTSGMQWDQSCRTPLSRQSVGPASYGGTVVAEERP